MARCRARQLQHFLSKVSVDEDNIQDLAHTWTDDQLEATDEYEGGPGIGDADYLSATDALEREFKGLGNRGVLNDTSSFAEGLAWTQETDA